MESIKLLKQCIRELAHEHNLTDYFLRLNCLDKAVEENPDETALEKSLAFLRSYGREFTPYVNKDMYFAGIVGYFYLPRGRAGLCEDIGHYCPNYKTLVDEGINGIRARIEKTEAVDFVGKANKSDVPRILRPSIF